MIFFIQIKWAQKKKKSFSRKRLTSGLAVEKCTYLKEAYYPFLVANQSTI